MSRGSKILLLFGTALCSVFVACSSSNAPSGGGNPGTISFYVITPKGGPAIGPLEGAPIQVETRSGAIVATVTSDSSGHANLSIAADAYVVHPLPVPSRPDFYHPPQPSNIRVIANTTVFDTIYYQNPIVAPRSPSTLAH